MTWLRGRRSNVAQDVGGDARTFYQKKLTFYPAVCIVISVGFIIFALWSWIVKGSFGGFLLFNGMVVVFFIPTIYWVFLQHQDIALDKFKISSSVFGRTIKTLPWSEVNYLTMVKSNFTARGGKETRFYIHSKNRLKSLYNINSVQFSDSIDRFSELTKIINEKRGDAEVFMISWKGTAQPNDERLLGKIASGPRRPLRDMINEILL